MIDADAYREIARDPHLLAAATKSPEARGDLRLLAEEYEALAAHLEAKAALTNCLGGI
jgi:hypothetical protein